MQKDRDWESGGGAQTERLGERWRCTATEIGRAVEVQRQTDWGRGGGAETDTQIVGEVEVQRHTYSGRGGGAQTDICRLRKTDKQAGMSPRYRLK